MVLYNFERMRNSGLYNSYLNADKVNMLADKYVDYRLYYADQKNVRVELELYSVFTNFRLELIEPSDRYRLMGQWFFEL